MRLLCVYTCVKVMASHRQQRYYARALTSTRLPMVVYITSKLTDFQFDVYLSKPSS